ncbi:hypothetical protein [Streptomyces sp. 8N706]
MTIIVGGNDPASPTSSRNAWTTRLESRPGKDSADVVETSRACV